jgi:hypothetical protein
MRISSFVKNTVLLSLVLVLCAAPWATAAGQLAEVTNEGSRLIFTPLVEFAEMRLTVTGPCAYEYTQVVNEGDLVFELGETTIDGVYRYYLVRIEEIDPSVIQTLQQARLNDDPEVPKALCRQGVLPGPPQNQSEGFIVDRASIIYDPDAIEEGKVAAASQGQGASFAPGGSGPGASSTPWAGTTKDYPVNDDLIVDGSACIGFDCAVGESFGFDTIRLKENNLRIKFDDTSVLWGYPSNDWQLTANDSAKGGLSKFSIDDITNSRTPFTIEADAPGHSLYVDDSGRIGRRTSTPVVELHTVDGDTPTLRLQQDGSSGFSPQTWDVAGNETNFFLRDVSNGSKLPFRIRPAAPTSSIDIASNGDVGFGTGSPSANIHVKDTDGSGTETLLYLENNAGVRFDMLDNTTGVTWVFQNQTSKFEITKAGTGVRELSLDGDGNLTITGTLTVRDGYMDEQMYPDYVFEPDYPLLPIPELAAFIEEHKHLPKIPSAGTLAAEGINMTRLQMSLLEKVEELTLYTVAQEERIMAQDERIEQQNRVIAELISRLEALE